MKHKQLVTCLDKINTQNWNAHLHSSESLTGLPLSQFYIYSHSHDDSFMSCLSMDMFLSNIRVFSQIPESLNDPVIAASSLNHTYNKLLNNRNNKNLHNDVAKLLQFYMINTACAKQYFSQNLGQSFAFIVSLYPDNPSATQFINRPFIVGVDEILHPDQVKAYCHKVALSDKANGKSYFKHLEQY